MAPFEVGVYIGALEGYIGTDMVICKRKVLAFTVSKNIGTLS